MSKATLPAPRLQLRWAPSTDSRRQWMCHYELVMPLDKCDIRAEQEGPRGGKRPKLKEFVVPMKPPTCRDGNAAPCQTWPDKKPYYDPPFRDGAHAQWDAALLGDLPIYVIAPDGTPFKRPETEP